MSDVLGDAEVLPGRIEDAEIAQPPTLLFQEIGDRPPRGFHPVVLGNDILTPQDDLASRRRAPVPRVDRRGLVKRAPHPNRPTAHDNVDKDGCSMGSSR